MARIHFSQLITRIRPARLEPRNQLFIKLALEILETRLTPSISIQLDYSHDSSGFFTNHPDRESLLSTAANALTSRLGDSLSAIVPNLAAGDTWSAVFADPSTGAQTQINNLTVAANTIIIFAGGQSLGGGEDGTGGPGGLNANGDQAWFDIVEGRGKLGALGLAAQQTAFAPWGGSVTFDTSFTAWYFGADPAGIQSNQTDFLSVAEHELSHALGFGTSNSWTNRVLGSTFIGPNAVAEFGGPVPTDAAGSAAQHWADGTTDRGMHSTMDPSFNSGERDTFTPLDFAGLEDLGWTLLPPPPPVVNQTGWHDVVTGDFTGNGKQDIAGMTAAGQWWVAVSTGSSFTNQLWGSWNPSVTWVDVYVGDFNNDGKADIVGRFLQTGQWWIALSTGSSFTNQLWATWNPKATWVDVHVADFNGDGKADIVGRWLEGGVWFTGISSGSSFTTTAWAFWNPNVTWVDVNVGDFNGDGKADITGRWLQGGWWYTGISTGSSFNTAAWAQWNPNVTWVDVHAADFNGDGKADITGRWLQGGWWYTGISSGSSFNTAAWVQWNPNVIWVDVQVGDFTGDGKADITGRFLQTGQWFTSVSTGSSFTTSLWDTWSPVVTWVDVSRAEIDGDKFGDLIGRYSDTGQWWAAVSNGSSGFTNQLWTTWAS